MPTARLLIDLPVTLVGSGPLSGPYSSGGSAGPETGFEFEIGDSAKQIFDRLPNSPWEMDEQFLAARSPEQMPERLRMMCLGNFATLEKAVQAAHELGASGLAHLDWNVSADGQHWDSRQRI